MPERESFVMHMENHIRLAKGEVLVRPLTPEDAPLLLAWLTDPRVLEWYEGRDQVFTPERIRQDFYGSGPDRRRCAIEWADRPIGCAQICRLDQEGLREYGLHDPGGPCFGLDQFIGEPGCWGRGIGRAFVSLLRDYLILEEGAAAVALDPHVSNPRAVRCYEACGFRKEKLLPAHELHEGKWEDCWLMVSSSIMIPLPLDN